MLCFLARKFLHTSTFQIKAVEFINYDLLLLANEVDEDINCSMYG